VIALRAASEESDKCFEDIKETLQIVAKTVEEAYRAN
jgi:hypothetical protein